MFIKYIWIYKCLFKTSVVCPPELHICCVKQSLTAASRDISYMLSVDIDLKSENNTLKNWTCLWDAPETFCWKHSFLSFTHAHRDAQSEGIKLDTPGKRKAPLSYELSLFSIQASLCLEKARKKVFNPQCLLPGVKHGGGSVMVWAAIS